jgi:hypothetical protein
VITFRIASHTIKRGSHGYLDNEVPLGLIHEHMHLGSIALTYCLGKCFENANPRTLVMYTLGVGT